MAETQEQFDFFDSIGVPVEDTPSTVIEEPSNEGFDFQSIGQPVEEEQPFSFSEIGQEVASLEEVEPQDFSYFEDVEKNFSNIWESTKIAPTQYSLFRDNVIKKLYQGADVFGDILSETTGIDRDVIGNAPNQIVDERAVESIKKIDDYSKSLTPTQGIIDAFSQGDPEKIAASVTGAILNVSDSMIKNIATGGGYTVTQPIVQSYSDTLLEVAEETGNDASTMFINDEDKELIPVISGAISGGLEKIGLDKLSSKFLTTAPLGLWRKVFDVAKSGGTEGVTEFLQDVTDQVGKDLSTGRNLDVDWWQSFESGAQGLVGGGAVGSLGTALKSLPSTPVEEISTKDIDVSTKIGDLDLDQEVANSMSENKDLFEEFSKNAEGTEIQSEQDALDIVSEGLSKIGEDIDMDTKAEIDQAKLNLESASIKSTLDSRVDSGEITPDEAHALYESSVEDFKNKYSTSLGDSEAVTTEAELQQESSRNLTNIDLQKIKEIESLEVIENEDGTYDQKDLDEAQAIKKDIIENGVSKEADDKLIKLKNKRLVKESSNLNFNKDVGISYIGKVASELRNLPLNMMEISNLNQESLDFLDRNVKKKLDDPIIYSDKILRSEKEILQQHISDNNITNDDLIKVGMYGMLNSTYADPNGDQDLYKSEIDDNIKKIIKTADSKIREYSKGNLLTRQRNKGNLERAIKEKEVAIGLVSSFRNNLPPLTQEQSNLYGYMTDAFSQFEQDYKDTSRVYWGKELKPMYNYFPTRAIGGFKNNDPRDTNMQSYIEDKIQGKDDSLRKRKASISEGFHAKSRSKDVGHAYYDFNSADLFMDTVKGVTFEVKAAPAVKEIASMLTNKSIRKNLGSSSSSVLLSGLKSYVNNQRGVRKSSLIKGLDKVRSVGITAMLGSIGQLPKQFLPAVGQSFALVNANPIKFSKALKGLATLDNEWYIKNAPGIYERSLSMDRITFGGDEKFFRHSGETKRERIGRVLKKASEVVTTKPISIGDVGAARLAFLAAYVNRGGDFKNVDSKKIRQAQLDQEALQNVNSTAYAGIMFNSENEAKMLLTRTALTFTNFALQQTFSFLAGAKNIKTAQGRRLVMGALGSAVAYQAFASITRNMWDEFTDEALGEDDSDDDVEFMEKDLAKKSLIRGGVDVLIGGVPVVREAAQSAVEHINKITAGEDYDKYNDNIFFTSREGAALDEMAGAAISRPIESLLNIVSNTSDAVIEGKEGSVELALLETTRLLNYLLPYMPLPRGNVDAWMADLKKRYKTAQKEAIEADRSRSKSRRVNKRNINKIKR